MKLSNEELINELRERLVKASLPDQEEKMFQEVEQLGEQLKQSEQLKSNFLSNIRNEITNPLSAVLGISDFLLQAKEIDLKKLKRHAYLIHNEAFNLDFQMRNIFMAAELEAGMIEPEYAKIDIISAIKDVMASFEFKAKEKKLSVVESSGDNPIVFTTDAAMFNLIISNIYSNAIEYSLPDQKVEIYTELKEDSLLVCVKDIGIGLSKSDQKKIFDRFYQLDYGTTKQHRGQGLGLSVTQAMVELLSGTVEINSTKGKGSTFSITLPSVKNDEETDTKVEGWNEFLFGNDEVF
ncbi:HAMP domain-containing histidine kinase [Fulvivirga maritima]|uniref:sensor histidine kinase n=1 Tax=Fulvivirga maritima TaxID=2904247 RepID=UPI001F2216DA|nr:HAMP domain-containing sensor histidine kinase [Fulvivirga maritima]UII26819.1 HAMP domain-containing histidine kinase [Fulvivirga maritima]